MQTLKRIFTLAVIFMAVLSTKAQYDPSFAHYFDMEPSFNAAAIGKQAKLNIIGAYAMQMVGFEHNPRTMFISADMPFYFMKSYHGVGAQMMSDQIGLFNHQRLQAQYAYKQPLFGGTLGIGLQAGLLTESFDGSKLDLEDSSDPAFSSSETNGNQLDLGVGLYYMRGPLYIGASVQHINSPLVELSETNELQIDRTYYFTAGYNIQLRNPFLSIKPSVLVRSDEVGYRGDITARLCYTNDKKVMYGGISYSPTNSVTMLFGGDVQGITIGYSYEFYTSSLGIMHGSHELFVGYKMDLNLGKKGKNLHKSVRIL